LPSGQIRKHTEVKEENVIADDDDGIVSHYFFVCAFAIYIALITYLNNLTQKAIKIYVYTIASSLINCLTSCRLVSMSNSSPQQP
jgi:hypothetical protein